MSSNIVFKIVVAKLHLIPFALEAPRLIVGTLTSFGNIAFQVLLQFAHKVQYMWTSNECVSLVA